MNQFNGRTYLICSGFSLALMILFVMVNYPYFRSISGGQTFRTMLRTILLDSAAILIGWSPVVYFWPDFSMKILLPFACIVGALGCVGSRFIYPEIVPDALAKKLVEFMEKRSTGSST